jgi:hypothetical protein
MRPPRGGPLALTARQWADVATVHGVSYISSTELPKLERLLWAVIVLAFLGMAVFLGYKTIDNYQNNRVITTLSNTSKAVTDLAFPAVTICSKGLNMEAVKEALERDFEEWSKEQTGTGRGKRATPSAEDFMEKRFGVVPGSEYSFLDVLQAMAAPDVEAATSNAVRENLVACVEEQDTCV